MLEEESSDENTLFSLHFPSQLPADWEDILESAQRPYAIIGEAINVILVAQYRGTAEEEKRKLWQKRLCQLQVSASVSKHFSAHCKTTRITSPTAKNDVTQFVCCPVAICQEILNKRDPLVRPKSKFIHVKLIISLDYAGVQGNAKGQLQCSYLR